MNKSYYAIIPANIRYDEQLTDGAKLLYGEITALCNQEGFCWAGDGYFSELYKVSRSTVQRWLNQLEDKGYIRRVIKYKEGTRNIEHRYTYICDNPIPKNETTPIPKNETVNNTLLNTTVNNTRDKDIVGQPDSIPYKKIIDHLNKSTNKKYKHTTRKTKDLIKARYNEGFSFDDFIKVIDTKNEEWKNDDKMKNFIRPETLFGTKFESYLNQYVPPTDTDPRDYGF